jgi:hypothetical protein
MVADGPPGSLRGPSDRVRIEVDDVTRAIDAISGSQGITISPQPPGSSGPGTLLVTLAAGTRAADINAALVAAGVGVEALVPERDTLEDVFLHLVEGADVPR